jgi:hypothetical protein
MGVENAFLARALSLPVVLSTNIVVSTESWSGPVPGRKPNRNLRGPVQTGPEVKSISLSIRDDGRSVAGSKTIKTPAEERIAAL